MKEKGKGWIKKSSFKRDRSNNMKSKRRERVENGSSTFGAKNLSPDESRLRRKY